MKNSKLNSQAFNSLCQLFNEDELAIRGGKGRDEKLGDAPRSRGKQKVCI